MKRIFLMGLVVALAAGFTASGAVPRASAAPATSAQTYDVLVGLENANTGADVMAFFPATVYLHVGDTVHWIQNSNEIHTVTFLAGSPLPETILPAASGPSPLMFNPEAVNPAVPAGGMYDGSTYANSGLMGMEEGQAREFSLTFTQEGTFPYVCLVHGQVMSGEVIVVGSSESIPSPNQAAAQGKMEMAKQLAQVQDVVKAAKAAIEPPTTNPDGTTTHFVVMGYGQGQIDLLRFFPDNMTVSTGDTVIWEFSPASNAPHTVTFLNGAEEPSLVIPVPQPSGPPLLYINPAVLFPQGGDTLTREGIYNSGLMIPGPGPGPKQYSLTIGDVQGLIRYECLLHDSSGMDGTITVVPGKAGQ